MEWLARALPKISCFVFSKGIVPHVLLLSLLQHSRLLLYAEADGFARALWGLRHRAYPGSGMEQATFEPASYDNNDEADFWERWPQLVAAGAFRQQDEMKMLHPLRIELRLKP